MKHVVQRPVRIVQTLCVTASLLLALSSAAWGISLQIRPSSSMTNTPITFTVPECRDPNALCDLYWEFKNIDNASVVDGGKGYTITKRFDVAGNYRVMVTGRMSDGVGGYVSVGLNKTFTVMAPPFTVKIKPNPNWTVKGSENNKGGDGIDCPPDADEDSTLCTETYLPGAHLFLKVVEIQEGAEFLGWEVNDEVLTDEEYLKMLTPKE